MLGSFGPVEVEAPRARMAAADGGTKEWRSAVLPRYARMTRQVEALIAGAYLAGTNTRPSTAFGGCPSGGASLVKRALAALFRGVAGVEQGGSPDKDVVSRTLEAASRHLPPGDRFAMAQGADRLGCLERARLG